MLKAWKYSLIVAGLVTVFVNFFLRSRVASLPGSPIRLTLIAREFFEVISPSSYTYILNQPDVCKNRKPFLVLMIPVAPDDGDSRDAIRKTWGQAGLVQNATIVKLFYVGLPREDRDNHIQEALKKESHKHGDIIQMNFLDCYQNLTIKTMMIMNWLSSHCQRAFYAMKIDADIFLNVPFLVDYLRFQASPARHDYISGSVIADGRPRRNKNSKWYLSEEIYPDATFPPYVSGAGYVFSIDLAKKISWASQFARPIPLEDVYVGLCLRVLGVTPVYSSSLTSPWNRFVIRRLEYQRCTYSKLIIVTGFTPHQLINIWHDFQKAQFTC